MRHHLAWVGFLCLTVACGCSKDAPPPPSADEEKIVRERFAELQSAIKSGDADKLWAMLDKRSQTDADRIAQGIRTSYEKASNEEKAEQEKALGLTGAELTTLTGKGFLKAGPFHKKYHELPDGQIEKVVVGKEGATVHFLEPDGDKEKAAFVRQDGQWKAWLTMPKADNK
jgi:hypothetical protein